MGLNFSIFIKNICLEEVKKQLFSISKNVKEIVYDVGFFSLVYFFINFKVKFGYSFIDMCKQQCLECI